MPHIRVLVVDDSVLFREIMDRGLSSDPSIEVVAKAKDAFDARDKILQYHPDVMTLDIEMPKMNGIEFLRKLMPQYPIPTVVISGTNMSVFDAINVGAVDFVKKPERATDFSSADFIDDVILKVKTAVTARFQKTIPLEHCAIKKEHEKNISKKLIAIGASTGGTVALTSLLASMDPPLPGIVVVQHIPPVFSDMFAKRLNSVTHFSVKEAVTGDRIVPGQVLIAPGSMHMQVKKRGSEYIVECFSGEKVNGHCPSVDVLFHSIAPLGASAIGVILTGMGYDGAKGLLEMRQAGARTVGQDEKTSVVYGMPKVAYNIGAVERQLPIEKIGETICSFI